VKTIEYLFSPELAPLFWPGVSAALLVALMCAPLSPLVVLKKLSFVGQGVSHAAFGGVGLALYGGALLGMSGWTGSMQAVVVVFSVSVGLWISALSRGRSTDTAIGIVLAACMAIGFVLYRLAAGVLATRGSPVPPGIDDVLFGSVLRVGWGGVWATGVATLGVIGALWWIRRPLIAWAFDEATAGSLGVSRAMMRSALLVLLSVAVVATMQIAGVVLATALLVLPGVIGLGAGARLSTVIAVSFVSAVLGVCGGLVLSFEFGVQTGPSIVLVMLAVFVLARLARRGAAV
jgi:zinc transport system permease protein